ncbi:anthranilate synthase component II [Marchantia polymorpha subsp. ruderalis]|uniref:anthranilate synthase n=2 Tax=Marchantia polymorpha TaxID=3197 RepID=A0A176WQ25_MARPO|nr:hypothetical protein AXG93_1550s1130 [Marchantia polymorpha subsp. ruderalis]PTQ40971.1 hypothetical protein MARPO_0037s0136 [Marchantia polymorpha]BBN05133.1 hypothetical protein Mp_3g10600 [Marchantia polymorpha subsp. ruderalis]|eukprot:PTQ40971.1 hypothetical protein MARPO_0037s0136 [Marchantia polymorpha]
MAVPATATSALFQSAFVRLDGGPQRFVRFQSAGLRSNVGFTSQKGSQYRGVKRSSAFFPCLKAQASQSAASSTPLGPVIVIDNYDSFTYNLCQYLGDLGCNYQVYRNDEISIEELKEKNPRGILISPGPGTPQDSGIALQSILELGADVPIFGVCMGLQCMGEAYGGKIVRAPNGVVHGKSSPIFYDEKGEDGLLGGLSNPFEAARYHSLVIEKASFPSDELEVTAWTDDGLIMGIRHRKYRHVQGVQFHPESIITPEGKKIVANFLSIIAKKWSGEGLLEAVPA